MQNESVSLRIAPRDKDLSPLVRYPINPIQRTLLHGQIPAINPKIKIPRYEGSRVVILIPPSPHMNYLERHLRNMVMEMIN